MDQSEAPLLDALIDHRQSNRYGFTPPGHRQGRGTDDRVLKVLGHSRSVMTCSPAVGCIIRESLIRALAATGEWPIRIDVDKHGSDDGQTKRWFVEYETGPYGQAIDQPAEPV